jgi:hypothetical protein
VVSTSKSRELLEELRTVFSGRSNLLDSILPPTIFVLLNAFLGFEVALWGSLAVALIITVLRLLRHQPLGYALGGLGGVLLAVLVAWLLGRAEGYFLPNIITGAGLSLLCVVSVLAGRPMVAWTSYVVRRWPLAWYWHLRVRPAYSEVTLAWAVFFALRLAVQLWLLREQVAGFLSIVNVLAGWPATLALLVISYLYGTWRLRNLGGPSVEEFQAGAGAPWEGQRRGF